MTLTKEDFEKVKQILEEADVRDHELYLHHSGKLIAIRVNPPSVKIL